MPTADGRFKLSNDSLRALKFQSLKESQLMFWSGRWPWRTNVRLPDGRCVASSFPE
jgi:hypothetical protein